MCKGGGDVDKALTRLYGEHGSGFQGLGICDSNGEHDESTSDLWEDTQRPLGTSWASTRLLRVEAVQDGDSGYSKAAISGRGSKYFALCRKARNQVL